MILFISRISIFVSILVSILVSKPVSILPLLSKVYERIIYNQLSQHSEQFLNSILCGFNKCHNTQHPLFKLLPSSQWEFDSGGFVGTILWTYQNLMTLFHINY